MKSFLTPDGSTRYRRICVLPRSSRTPPPPPPAYSSPGTSPNSASVNVMERKVMNESIYNEILKSIALVGAADQCEANTRIIIGSPETSNHIISRSSGMPRIQTSVTKKFKLVLSQPLAGLSSFEIRCALCRKVISYPCWYYKVKYAVNHFHYFLCFDVSSPSKPTCKCRRPTND